MSKESFKFSSEISFATVQADCRRLSNYCRNSKEALLSLDLSEVRHCDSAGLALLIEAKRMSAEQNKVCKIENIPKAIYALAEFCGLDKVLELTVSP